ncbi:carbohydrate ABC transporter permease [Anaerocolumna jejuensis]|uniref:carbohydrate ABC transporter permease n=1 Tax=Anaerocolumna jejuensis TaxID=259063 RepID=UPI003F7C90E6
MKKRAIIPNIILALTSIICLVPFLLLIISSLTDENTLLLYGYSFFPRKWSLRAYQYIWQQGLVIVRAYGITVFVTLAGTLVGLMITAMLAYPLSRKDLPLGRIFAFFVFFTMLFNGGLVPTYLMYVKYLHIKNTLLALIVPGLLVNSFFCMIMRSYFVSNIPDAVIESAYIDGANEFKIFSKMILPLSKPIMATIGLFLAINYWNDWYNGLIYLTDTKLFSIQNVLNRMISDAQFLASSNLGSTVNAGAIKIPSTSVRMAIAVVTILPILMAYPFFQKYFIKGITIGSVKG